MTTSQKFCFFFKSQLAEAEAVSYYFKSYCPSRYLMPSLSNAGEIALSWERHAGGSSGGQTFGARAAELQLQ